MYIWRDNIKFEVFLLVINPQKPSSDFRGYLRDPISQSNKDHRKTNFQYYLSDLYCNITLYSATTIDLQLGSINIMSLQFVFGFHAAVSNLLVLFISLFDFSTDTVAATESSHLVSIIEPISSPLRMQVVLISSLQQHAVLFKWVTCSLKGLGRLGTVLVRHKTQCAQINIKNVHDLKILM